MTGRLRWGVKKGARRAVARLAPRGPADAPRVLTFHRFADRARDPFAVPPAVFAEQVAELARRGVAVGLDALDRALAGQMRLPPGAVLLTIDDGCESTLSVAAPILARHGVKAAAFVTGARVGVDAGGGPERFLRADEIRALPSFGIDVGAHGWTHRSLGTADAASLALELGGTRHFLEDLLGREIRAFAYPYGTARDHSPASRAAAERAGYRLGFTSVHGAVGPEADALALPRVKVEGGEGRAMFDAICRGGLDAWRLVDRRLSRWQARALKT